MNYYRIKKSFLALILILAFVFSQANASSILGTQLINTSTYEIAKGATYTNSVFFNPQVGEQAENYVTYTPNSDVTPIVAYNNTVFGRADINKITDNLVVQGKRVITGINADFFSLQTGVPMGLVVSNGRLITSDDNRLAIGFDSNNKAFIGKPQLKTELKAGEFKMNIDHLNKFRQPYCIYLLNRDFSDTTKNSTPGIDIILSPTNDEMKIGGKIEAVVEKVLHNEADMEIPVGKMVLTVDDTAPQALLDQMKTIIEGQKVEIAISTTDERFITAKYAVGAHDKLITAGNQETEFTLSGAAPRTALGIKEDGSIVLYTIDGRQSGYSYGILMTSLATRLKELGCVEAVNLDGGGSTSITTQAPGNAISKIVNRPSDGSSRKCSSYIFLTSTSPKTGILDKLHLYPQNSNLLSGASVNFDVKATDTSYYPFELTKSVDFEVNSSSVTFEKSKPSIISFAGEGTATITAKSEKATGNATVNVYKTPTNIIISNEETKEDITSVTLKSGGIINLSAKAYNENMPLESNDNCFKWNIDGDIGKINEDGVFTAVNSDKKKGKITVSAGEKTVTLEVAVGYDMSITPFADTTTHWAKAKLNFLYYNDIINGSADKSGKKYFRPDETMNRAEFCVMMSNYLKTDLEQYKNVVLPFDDLNSIPNWAINQVKAMYKLEIIKGQQAGKTIKFNPLSDIKRAEAITIVERTIKNETPEEKVAFADLKDIPSWALKSVAKLTSLEIVKGYGDNTIKPNNILKRAEAATMIYETLQKMQPQEGK